MILLRWPDVELIDRLVFWFPFVRSFRQAADFPNCLPSGGFPVKVENVWTLETAMIHESQYKSPSTVGWPGEDFLKMQAM